VAIFAQPKIAGMSLIINGRGERIRTFDPLVPNQIQVIIEICRNSLAATVLD
jgi:hypothetical protein